MGETMLPLVSDLIPTSYEFDMLALVGPRLLTEATCFLSVFIIVHLKLCFRLTLVTAQVRWPPDGNYNANSAWLPLVLGLGPLSKMYSAH